MSRRPEMSDAEDAGRYLDRHPGCAVDWEPGDCTLYEVALVKDVKRSISDAEEVLVILNLGGHVIPLPPRDLAPDALRLYWVQRLPRGSWAGLRPLLAALRAAEGPLRYDRDDAADEAALRRSTV